MSHSLTFNSTDCSGSTYRLTVAALKTQILSEPKIELQNIVTGWGAVSNCRQYGPRVFVVSCVVEAASAALLKTQTDNLRVLFDPMNGERTLKFDDYESDRYWYAILTSPIEAPVRGATYYQFDLEFIAPDPRAYSTTEKDLTFTLTTSPQTVSVEGAGTALGATAETDPVWVLTNSGSAISAVTLNNTTRGESITVTNSIATGHKIKIDRPNWLVSKSTNAGASYSAIMSSVGSTGIPPALKPGVVNSVTVTGITSGSLKCTYRERYL